jgi:hypothetical protein
VALTGQSFEAAVVESSSSEPVEAAAAIVVVDNHSVYSAQHYVDSS